MGNQMPHTHNANQFIVQHTMMNQTVTQIPHHHWKQDWKWKSIICDALRYLLPFVQFKNMKNMEECYFWLKLQASACNFTKSNTPAWVVFTFFKLHKWCQIVRRISYAESINIFLASSDYDSQKKLIVRGRMVWHEDELFTRYFLLITRYYLLVTTYSLLCTCCSLLFIRYSLLLTRHSLLFIRHYLFVTHYFSLVIFH